MSWYRTYRPQTVAALHIASVRQVYQQILDTGSFSHAYLMAGPRGTGKTSGARILAKILNCDRNKDVVLEALDSKKKKTEKQKPLQEPCNECASCIRITAGTSMCVTEMDAASNRGIDDIRELAQRIGLSPSDGQVSVHIIDEVHMLTTEAFNALLKILEEPPAHVVFALATTELHKVPQTVISRCTVIPYRKASGKEILTALQQIATKEDITISEELLERFVLASDGSFRDGVKLFEQVAQGKKTITIADIASVLGESEREYVVSLIQSLLAKSYEETAAIFEKAEQAGLSMSVLQKETLRMLLIAATTKERSTQQRATYIHLLTTISVPFESQLPFPHLPFELACLQWCLGDTKKTLGTSDPSPIQKPSIVNTNHAIAVKAVMQQKKSPDTVMSSEKIPVKPENNVEQKQSPRVPLLSFSEVSKQWPNFLASVHAQNTSLEAFLKLMRPVGMDGAAVLLQAQYKFHKEQLETSRNRQLIEQIMNDSFGCPLHIEVELTPIATMAAKSPDSNVSGTVEDPELVQAVTDALL